MAAATVAIADEPPVACPCVPRWAPARGSA